MEKIQTGTDYGRRNNNDNDIIMEDNVVYTTTISVATNMPKTIESKKVSWLKAIWTGRTTNRATDAKSFSHLRKVLIVTIVSLSGTT